MEEVQLQQQEENYDQFFENFHENILVQEKPFSFQRENRLRKNLQRELRDARESDLLDSNELKKQFEHHKKQMKQKKTFEVTVNLDQHMQMSNNQRFSTQTATTCNNELSFGKNLDCKINNLINYTSNQRSSQESQQENLYEEEQKQLHIEKKFQECYQLTEQVTSINQKPMRQQNKSTSNFAQQQQKQQPQKKQEQQKRIERSQTHTEQNIYLCKPKQTNKQQYQQELPKKYGQINKNNNNISNNNGHQRSKTNVNVTTLNLASNYLKNKSQKRMKERSISLYNQENQENPKEQEFQNPSKNYVSTCQENSASSSSQCDLEAQKEVKVKQIWFYKDRLKEKKKYYEQNNIINNDKCQQNYWNAIKKNSSRNKPKLSEPVQPKQGPKESNNISNNNNNQKQQNQEEKLESNVSPMITNLQKPYHSRQNSYKFLNNIKKRTQRSFTNAAETQLTNELSFLAGGGDPDQIFNHNKGQKSIDLNNNLRSTQHNINLYKEKVADIKKNQVLIRYGNNLMKGGQNDNNNNNNNNYNNNDTNRSQFLNNNKENNPPNFMDICKNIDVLKNNTSRQQRSQRNIESVDFNLSNIALNYPKSSQNTYLRKPLGDKNNLNTLQSYKNYQQYKNSQSYFQQQMYE